MSRFLFILLKIDHTFFLKMLKKIVLFFNFGEIQWKWKKNYVKHKKKPWKIKKFCQLLNFVFVVSVSNDLFFKIFFLKKKETIFYSKLNYIFNCWIFIQHINFYKFETFEKMKNLKVFSFSFSSKLAFIEIHSFWFECGKNFSFFEKKFFSWLRFEKLFQLILFFSNFFLEIFFMFLMKFF